MGFIKGDTISLDYSPHGFEKVCRGLCLVGIACSLLQHQLIIFRLVRALGRDFTLTLYISSMTITNNKIGPLKGCRG